MHALNEGGQEFQLASGDEGVCDRRLQNAVGPEQKNGVRGVRK